MRACCVTPVQDGDNFTSSDVWHPFQKTFTAALAANAFYQKGPDGTAAEYGTAFARFDYVSIVAHIAAVPEPDSMWLLLAGAGGLVGYWRWKTGALHLGGQNRRS